MFRLDAASIVFLCLYMCWFCYVKKIDLFVLFVKKGLFVLFLEEKGLFSSSGTCNDKRLFV